MLTILRSKRCFAVRVHTLANVFTSVWPRPRGLWNHPICQLTSDAVHLLWLWWGSPEYCSSSLPCRLGRSHSRHLTSSFVERVIPFPARILSNLRQLPLCCRT